MSLKRKPDVTYYAGKSALELAKQDKSILEPRLPAGVIDGLAEDLELLNEFIDEQRTAQVVKKAATRRQEDVAQRLYERIRIIREMVRRARLPKEVQTTLGIGKTMRPTYVREVTTAAALVIAGYRQYTDGLRECGVLPADIQEIEQLRSSLITTDMEQEETKVTAKEKTALRNLALDRVERAIVRLTNAAQLAFIDNPERVQAYRALLVTKKTSKTSTKEAD